MFAIVEIAGAQHTVKKGDKLEIQKLEGEAGAKMTSHKVLMKFEGDKVEVGAPYLEGATVDFVIKDHFKADKIRVYKKKAKKRYERTQGHRQKLTTVEITAIG